MQHSNGLELRKQWGDRPCEHSSLAAEFFEQLPTGDYLCRRCGKVFESWNVPDRKSEDKNDNK